MDTIWSLDWRPYPAAVLTAVGLVLATRGGILMVRGFLAPYARPGKNLHTVRAMRGLLQGISLVAIALGWWLHWPALFWAGLIVGFEETIETSLVVWALRQEFQQSQFVEHVRVPPTDQGEPHACQASSLETSAPPMKRETPRRRLSSW